MQSVAGLVGVITAAALKTALAIAAGDVSGLGSLATASSVTASQISNASANGRSLITAADYAAMKVLLAIAAADITDASANARSFLQAANYAAMTALLPAVVGDSGSGGTKGLVPAPAAGDAAAAKYLKADGSYAVPPGTAATLATLSDAETGTENTKTMTALRVSQAIIDRPTSLKNICGRNGGMEIWQRGTPVAVAASATAYTLDGWYLATGANQACTVTQATGLTNGSPFAAQVARNSSQTGTGTLRFAMPLDTDELYKLRGNAALLSFTVKAGANWSPTSGTLTYNLYCGTGAVGKRNSSAYASESNPITGTINLSAGGSATTVISAISSAIGATITQAELQFSWAPTGTAGANDWVQIDDVQLEIVPAGVTAATPVFERVSTRRMLAECQRHFEQLVGYLYGSQANGTLNSTAIWHFKVTKRVTPTITLGAGSVGTAIAAYTDSYSLQLTTNGTYPTIATGSTASAEI